MTYSAPMPTPMMPRRMISQVIEGATAEARQAKPKIARLNW